MSCCIFCDEPFEDGWTHYGCDIRTNEERGDRYLVWNPCCLDALDEVQLRGFEHFYGRTLLQVAQDIDPSTEALEITKEDSAVVARLVILDLSAPKGKPSAEGVYSAKSPSGWRDELFEFVDTHHRHHDAPTSHKFSIAVHNGPVRVGVAVVGRPVSRMMQASQPRTLEVTRVCTHGHRALTKNASSKLYAASCKKAKKLGATKLITYTLFEVESGHSLVASGWVPTQISAGGSWSRRGRERTDHAPTGRKVRWEKGLDKVTQQDVEARRISLG